MKAGKIFSILTFLAYFSAAFAEQVPIRPLKQDYRNFDTEAYYTVQLYGYIKYLNKYDSKMQFINQPLKAFVLKRIDDKGLMKISLMINKVREFWSDGFLAELEGIREDSAKLSKKEGRLGLGDNEYQYKNVCYMTHYLENDVNLKNNKHEDDFVIAKFTLSTSQEIFQPAFLT